MYMNVVLVFESMSARDRDHHLMHYWVLSSGDVDEMKWDELMTLDFG